MIDGDYEYTDPYDPPAAGPVDPHHRYNLQNQSWGLPRKDKLGVLTDPIDVYTLEYGDRPPNNTEVVWTGLQYQPVTGTADPYERMYPNLYREVLGAGIPAAKGFYIIDLLNRGTSRVSSFEKNYANAGGALHVATFTTNEDRTVGGPSVVAEFAGRVFYSGFQGSVVGGDALSPNLSNYVVFSQLVRNSTEIIKCYQEGDPTSRDGSDVVDTDGGHIRITGAQGIRALQATRTSLIVFADNGVWSISGTGDNGFTATGYTVSKLSDYGCISPRSIVVYGDKIVYWSREGIYIIERDKFAQFVIQSISDKSIQSFYDDISTTAKMGCKGAYDAESKRISWLFKEGAAFNTNSVTKELVLDTTISAFSVNRIYNTVGVLNELVDLYYYKNNLTFIAARLSGSTSYFGFGSYQNIQFKDFGQVDAKAYLLTGNNTANDSAIAKQAPYLVSHMAKTETGVTSDGVPLNTSSCLMRPQWDWSYNTNSKKFGSLAEIYVQRRPLSDGFTDNGFDTVVRKSKLRGRGKALSLYFETSPEKDCHLLGWSLTLNGNANT